MTAPRATSTPADPGPDQLTYVRTRTPSRGGRIQTIHRAGCDRALGRTPWVWATGKTPSQLRDRGLRLCKVCLPPPSADGAPGHSTASKPGPTVACPTCTTRIPYRRAFCAACWALLPVALQRRVAGAYQALRARPGDEDAIDGHLAAIEAAAHEVRLARSARPHRPGGGETP